MMFQAHSNCVQNLTCGQSSCQFGQLEPIFLPPVAISLPRTQFALNSTIPAKPSKDGALMQARKRRALRWFDVEALDVDPKIPKSVLGSTNPYALTWAGCKIMH